MNSSECIVLEDTLSLTCSVPFTEPLTQIGGTSTSQVSTLITKTLVTSQQFLVTHASTPSPKSKVNTISIYVRDLTRLGKHGAYKFCDQGAPDHMFYEFACDYNNMPFKNPFSFGMGRGPFSIRRNCFLGRDMSGNFQI